MDKYIHNTSGAEKVYLGTAIADNAYLLIPPLLEVRAREDDKLLADIALDDARMSRDGVADLSISDSLLFLSYFGEALDLRFRGDLENSNGFAEGLNVQTAIEASTNSAVGSLIPYPFVSNGNTSNKWLSFSSGGFATSDIVPMIVPQGSTIKGITFSNQDDDVDIDVEIYVNGTLQHTCLVRNKRVAWEVGTLNVSMSQGDRLSIYVKKYTGGTGDSTPQNIMVTILAKITSESGTVDGIQYGV